MKQLNNYILEKFKINKDTKVSKASYIKDGDKFFIISIRENPFSKDEAYIKFYEPFTIIKLDETKIKYKVDDKEISQDIFINSNSYIETQYHKLYAVYLTINEGITFLKYYIGDKESAIKDLNFIFDKTDSKILSSKNIKQQQTDDEINDILNKLKDEDNK